MVDFAPLRRLRVQQVQPFTYRDGITFLELLERLATHVKDVLEPSLKNVVDDLVEQFTTEMGEHRDAYVEGVEEFQRIHDAFMADVNAHLKALNDTAVSDLVDDPTSLLFGVLDRNFTSRDRFEQAVVNAADFGAVPDSPDSTQGIQDAIDYAHEHGLSRVIVNGLHNIRANIPGDYGRGGTYAGRPPGGTQTDFLPGKYEGGIWLKSGITLDLRSAELRVIPNDSLRYSLIQITDVENVEILGGNLIGDRDEHVGTDGEWGAGVYMRNSRNVSLNGTRVSEMWGDGISVTVGSHDVTIHDVHSDHNRRQGMSITGGRNIHTTNSTFTNTEGTLPMSGVDIEPNNDTDECENITFRGCEFSNNEMYGLMAMGRSVRHVVVDGCVVSGNRVDTGVNGQLRFVREPKDVVIRDTVVQDSRNMSLELATENAVVDGCNFDHRVVVRLSTEAPDGASNDVVLKNSVLQDSFQVLRDVRLVLENNVISTVTNTAWHLNNQTNSVLIVTGNIFKQSDFTPLRSSGLSNARYVVSNNVFQDYPDYAIRLMSTGSTHIYGNTFVSDTDNVAVFLQTGSENVLVEGNVHVGSGHFAFVVTVTNVKIANNHTPSLLRQNPTAQSLNTWIELNPLQWWHDGEVHTLGTMDTEGTA